MGLSRKHLPTAVDKECCRKKNDSLSVKTRPGVLEFFERDDNSRIITSKKDTITRKSIKKQRRLLLNTLQNFVYKVLPGKPFR